jgi:hypothetical protein
MRGALPRLGEILSCRNRSFFPQDPAGAGTPTGYSRAEDPGSLDPSQVRLPQGSVPCLREARRGRPLALPGLDPAFAAPLRVARHREGARAPNPKPPGGGGAQANDTCNTSSPLIGNGLCDNSLNIAVSPPRIRLPRCAAPGHAGLRGQPASRQGELHAAPARCRLCMVRQQPAGGRAAKQVVLTHTLLPPTSRPPARAPWRMQGLQLRRR